MKPQAAYSHETVKNIIEDVTQSSAMRLDPKSMDKLWDLITMVFKWQATLSADLLKLTARHLYEIENYVTTEETQLQLHKVQNLFDNFIKILNNNEKIELREHVLTWLVDYSVRVSLLLRLGLQDADGNFVVDNLNSFAEDMLRNLGENIYSVTQNGQMYKHSEKDEETKSESEALELKLMADQIMGERKSSRGDNNILKLAISQKDETKEKVQFDIIAIEANCNQIDDLFDDLNLSDDKSNFHDDLINMIENNNQ